jgi:hypothetical protein
MNPLEATWLVFENRAHPGELVTLQAGAEKYALVYTDAALAGAFLADLNDPDLHTSSLETWVLKDAFLTAAALIGATRVLFDYQRGMHDATSAPLEGLQGFVRDHIGTP